MPVAFPVAKLVTLVIKQVSKPLTQAAIRRAKNNHFFRSYVCMPPAQLYHWCEVRMKMYVMNIGRTGDKPIPKLNEEAAIELGANLLGEGVIFGIAAAILTFEVMRSKEKEKSKEDDEKAYLTQLETRINDLEYVNEEMDTKMRELTRLLYSIQHKVSMAQMQNPDKSQNQQSGTQPKINQAINDVTSKMGRS